MNNKHHKPAAQADGQAHPVIIIDLSNPEFSTEEQGRRKLACISADRLPSDFSLSDAFQKYDWIAGAFNGATHILLLTARPKAGGIPFLAPAHKSSVAMALPERGTPTYDRSFFVAWRNALDAMLGRTHGCRVTFYSPEILSLYEDSDIAAGQVEMCIGALIPRGGAALAAPPDAYPAAVLADLLRLPRRARKVTHWPARGLHPTHPGDETYIGPALSVRCDLLSGSAWWGATLLDECTNAAEFQVVRPDSTMGFAERGQDGAFAITRLDQSRLPNRGSARG